MSPKGETFEDGEKHKNEEWSVNNMLKSFFNILSDVVSVESKQLQHIKEKIIWVERH